MDEQRYEINIKRFIQSADYQLKKLIDCINKLKEFQYYEDWQNVKKAQLNACQILKRIKSDIKEMEKIRNQVVSELDDKSSSAIVNQIDEQLKDITRKVIKQAEDIDSIHPPYYSFEIKNQDCMIETGTVGPGFYEYSIQKNDILEKEKDLCDAYNQLEKDCGELKKVMEIFSKEINGQKPTIDTIEKNITNAQVNVESGASSLSSALSYKSFATAAGGAIVGTVVGGPIGFFAGAKIGAAVGLGSGVVGYYFARRYNKPN